MARISVELPDSFIFKTQITVRASDLNYGNHVGHDRILTLVQEARIQLYRHLGFKNELNFDGPIGQVIADAVVVYKSEAFLGDVLICSLGVTDFHKYGFDMVFLLSNESTQKEIARGKVGIVCLDYDTRKIAHVPPVLLNKLRPQE